MLRKNCVNATGGLANEFAPKGAGKGSPRRSSACADELQKPVSSAQADDRPKATSPDFNRRRLPMAAGSPVSCNCLRKNGHQAAGFACRLMSIFSIGSIKLILLQQFAMTRPA